MFISTAIPKTVKGFPCKSLLAEMASFPNRLLISLFTGKHKPSRYNHCEHIPGKDSHGLCCVASVLDCEKVINKPEAMQADFLCRHAEDMA